MDILNELKEKSYNHIVLIYKRYTDICWRYNTVMEVKNTNEREISEASAHNIVQIDQTEMTQERNRRLRKEEENIVKDVDQLTELRNDVHHYLVSSIDSYCYTFKELTFDIMEKLMKNQE